MAERGVILVDPYPRSVRQIFRKRDRSRLESLGDVVWHDGPPAGEELVEEQLPHAVAIVGQTALPGDRLARAPRLEAVVNVEGNFLPNIDYAECFRRGIRVLCASPVFAHPVAELALGMALAAARDIPGADSRMRSRGETLFDEGHSDGYFLLAGKTVGIVGAGAIGRRLIELLAPFRCSLLTYDPWVDPNALCDLGAEPARIEDLFERSRVVFVTAAATSENERLIDRRLLGRMAPGSVLVLVSRAALVDWDDLVEAAASGRIRVAVDVFPQEPVPPDERLRDVPDAILSAHRAGNVPEVWPVMGEMVADDLELILAGKPPQRCAEANPETVGLLRSRPIG